MSECCACQPTGWLTEHSRSSRKGIQVPLYRMIIHGWDRTRERAGLICVERNALSPKYAVESLHGSFYALPHDGRGGEIFQEWEVLSTRKVRKVLRPTAQKRYTSYVGPGYEWFGLKYGYQRAIWCEDCKCSTHALNEFHDDHHILY